MVFNGQTDRLPGETLRVSQKQVSREHTANLLSRLTFQWLTPLIAKGYKQPLEPEDIWVIASERNADVLATNVQTHFNTAVHRNSKHPLFWALCNTFRRELVLGGICRFLADMLQILGPFSLRYLLQYVADVYRDRQASRSDHQSIRNGVGLAVGISLMLICQSFCQNHSTYFGSMCGAQTRAALVPLIFEKSFRLSPRAKKTAHQADQPQYDSGSSKIGKKDPDVGIKAPWNDGRIVNLCSTDTSRLDTACIQLHLAWTTPISLCLTLALLILNITYSALAGFGLLVIVLPILTFAIKFLIRQRRAMNKIADRRVSFTQEIFRGIKFIKFFGWEASFVRQIQDIRIIELKALRRLLNARVSIHTTALALPIYATMLSFVTYALCGHRLDAAKIFSSVALFNCLRSQLSLLPQVLGRITDAWSSLLRLQEFLLLEERQVTPRQTHSSSSAIELQDADFCWDTANRNATISDVALNTNQVNSLCTDSFQLRSIRLNIRRGELLAVVGSVGSGKTSLLSAITGEMTKLKGTLYVNGSEALCPQNPWIQNTTAKNNIIFGGEFDAAKYQQVLQACSLIADFEILPNGDMTEIGERGVTISGGQKQRLSLARAIYSDADIVLMDDPLSAVDAHVGEHIFDHAIAGLLADKTRVLATHQRHVLFRCDRIVWVEYGHIKDVGTFNELAQRHSDFAEWSDNAGREKPDVSAQKSRTDELSPKSGSSDVTLMQLEDRAVSSVKWKVYHIYLSSTGSILIGPLIILVLVTGQCIMIATNLWLSFWVSDKFPYLSLSQYIGIYVGLGAAQFILFFAYGWTTTRAATRASNSIFNQAMVRTMGAPMIFFETNPLGRILNRFARDLDVMDSTLVEALRICGMTIANILSALILTIVFYYYFAIAVIPFIGLVTWAAVYYRASARELKRFESIFRSKVLGRFSEALTGATSIRAYNMERHFFQQIRDAVDEMNGSYFLTIANQRWLSIRLDLLGNLLFLVSAILVVTVKFHTSPSIAGLILSTLLPMIQLLQSTVRQFAEVDNAMISTERVIHYSTEIEQEEKLTSQSKTVTPAWPEKGGIDFNHVAMKYRPTLPLALDQFHLQVAPGEHIGIVGRTGAGKSSILSILFRHVELTAGSITIDGVDTSQVSLELLRSKMAIIPQDPTLFQGTIRTNLDPFNTTTDHHLLWALQKANFRLRNDNATDAKGGGSFNPIALDDIVEEDGHNFSLGQRQLLALARALARDSQITVCDEATSSIDEDTDRIVQRTIAEAFKNKTLLCIAHRLRTVIGYDRICVLDRGRILECASPLALFEQKATFWEMCVKSGISRKDIIKASPT